MYNRIKQHVYTDNLISLAQFGFRENSTTEIVIYTLTSHVLEMLESRNHAVGIFCDLTKAFDFICHDILLSKLEPFRKSNRIKKAVSTNQNDFLWST
jgi:hypothetical protein